MNSESHMDILDTQFIVKNLPHREIQTLACMSQKQTEMLMKIIVNFVINPRLLDDIVQETLRSTLKHSTLPRTQRVMLKLL